MKGEIADGIVRTTQSFQDQKVPQPLEAHLVAGCILINDLYGVQIKNSPKKLEQTYPVTVLQVASRIGSLFIRETFRDFMSEKRLVQVPLLHQEAHQEAQR